MIDLQLDFGEKLLGKQKKHKWDGKKFVFICGQDSF